jgi:hypothetical protein
VALAAQLSGKCSCHASSLHIWYACELTNLATDQTRVDSLSNAIVAAEACGTHVQGLLSQLKQVLESIYGHVHPKEKAPEALGALVEFFCASKDPMRGFGNDQSRIGAATALTQIMAHGIEGDLERACSSRPMEAEGKEVDLAQYVARADILSRMIASLLKGLMKSNSKSSATVASSTAT